MLLNVAPMPPLIGGAAMLDYIAAYKIVCLIELVSLVGLSLPAMIVFLALYVALVTLVFGALERATSATAGG